MANRKIKLPIGASVFILFGMVLLSLQLMSSATQKTSELNEMYSLLLLINIIGSIVLLVLVGVNIYSLIRQLKKREAGSRLTTRMILLFVLLSLAPAGIVYYFSMQFLHRSIDSWFNVEIDRAMEDALELSQASLDQRMRWHLKQTQQMVGKMMGKVPAAIELERLRDASGASEMTLFSQQGRVVASSSIDPSDILPSLPVDTIKLRLRDKADYVGLDYVRDDELVIQVFVRVGDEQRHYLQALYPVPVRIVDLADSVEFAFFRYHEMAYMRNSFKLTFSLALSLVLLLSLLAAIWVAFISIRSIIAPVKELVKGTQAVAAGHYEQQLQVVSQDDLGFLVESFNEMTARIAESQDETRRAGIEVENQRAYLETLLASLTSGVISFDAENKIRTANQAANKILHVLVSKFSGRPLSDLIQGNAELSGLVATIGQLMEHADDVWQESITLLGPSGRQELLCRGAPLFSPEGLRVGAVVVFDDITDLIQAEKNAAWGEVARRLAHEIKNPLTPIQLSAERLQHKLAEVLDPKLADMLERSTRTIVQQVEAMKRMVDDFSEYARPVKKQMVEINVCELIQEVLALYNQQSNIVFETQFAVDLPMVNVDPVSIRQVLHNLIKNALEAVGTTGKISIELHKVRKNQTSFIEMALYDNGPGIPQQKLETIFDPYVTTKPKGTGLGLAIVKKIIEEHGGAIWVDTAYNGGAGFIFRIPAI
jgi:two-component system, NtrC family, nitrogen regulation sensor histidine kinase NtrY